MKANIFCIAMVGLVFATTSCLACDQWDISGPVTIEHGSGLKLIGSFHQSGAALSGSLRYYSRALEKGLDVPVNGTVKGSVSGDQVRFRVAWLASWLPSSGPFIGTDGKLWESSGVYEGTIASDGHVEGTNFDLKDTGNKGSWSLADAARCITTPAGVSDVPQSPPSNPAPTPFVTAGPGHHLGKWPQAVCKTGFYHRATRPEDMICVTFESRAQTAYENAHAAERVNPSGAYGPNTCISGYVWRDAFDGDVVCTTVERRSAVKQENNTWKERTQ